MMHVEGGIIVWMTKTDLGFHTVYYCPQCKNQRSMHTINHNVWKCEYCGLELIYHYKDGKLHLGVD